MHLKDATAIVIKDALDNNNGNIAYEEIELMSEARRIAFVFKLMESDEFLMTFTNAIEDAINTHLDNYGEEYGIES